MLSPYTPQIVQGLSFLHLQNIVHGDIKPQNLLVRGQRRMLLPPLSILEHIGQVRESERGGGWGEGIHDNWNWKYALSKHSNCAFCVSRQYPYVPSHESSHSRVCAYLFFVLW